MYMDLVQNHVQCTCMSYLNGTRGFSIDQLKGKQLLPTFRPDALVIFRAKVLSPEDLPEHLVGRSSSGRFQAEKPLALKTTRVFSWNVGQSCFPLIWFLEDPLVPSFWSQLRITVLQTHPLWDTPPVEVYCIIQNLIYITNLSEAKPLFL